MKHYEMYLIDTATFPAHEVSNEKPTRHEKMGICKMGLKLNIQRKLLQLSWI